MKTLLQVSALVVVSLIGMASISVSVAADTPTTVSTPSVSERLDNARKAIAAKDWRLAFNELNTAVREEPRNADVHNLLGYSYRKKAQPDLPKAFEHYKRALEINPNHKGAHEYIGEAYLMDKKPQEALKHLAQLEKICGNKTCEEYADLAEAISKYKAENK